MIGLFSFFSKFFIISILSLFTIQATENRVKDVRIALPNGDLMPVIGLGTAGHGRLIGAETKSVLNDALAAGYRLFDTAAKYNNEEDIGNALRELLPKHNLTRKDIFITTKLAPFPEVYGEHAYEALRESVERIGLDYVDLYLIHFPSIFPPEPNKNYSKMRDESWQHLIRGQKEGLVRNIGVSNYNLRQLKELVNNDHGVKPVLNQVEWHPQYHQDDLLEYCNKEGIKLQAYFALGGMTNHTKLLDKQEVKDIAIKLNRTPAQVLLRWSIQQNVLVIPKSRKMQHLKENIDVDFEIPESDMKILSNLKQTEKYTWNPDNAL